MIRYLVTLLCFSITSIASFATQTKADSLYYAQNYADAINAYEAQLEAGVNADVYYNLGNCYYRSDNLPKAILNYLKSLKIEPQHEFAKENLQLCLNKMGIEMSGSDEMFYTTLTKSLVRSKNANDWGTTALITFALFIGFGVLYILLRKPLHKKIAFFASLVALLGVVIFNIFAYNSKQIFNTVEHVVALHTTPIYESATTTSKQVGELPAGAVLQLNEEFEDEWFNITLLDGRDAWCKSQYVEKVSVK